jgi:ABC-type multidrug transport system ATPase subunit
MGATGAGKTTLLDVLAQRKNTGDIGGIVKLQNCPASPEDVRAAVAYCEQMDVHSPYQTVREALVFSASLRLPAGWDREAVVADALRDLDLVHLAGAKVGLPGQPGALSVSAMKR